MGDLSAHFSRWEFRCKCGRCDYGSIDAETLKLLEKVRWYFDSRVTITSGHRCPEHNKSIKNSSPDSQHLKARAADIQVKGYTPEQVADYVKTIMTNYGGIGVYKDFVHVDTRQNKARW